MKRKVFCVELYVPLTFQSCSSSVRSSFDVNNWAIYELMGLPASIHSVSSDVCVRVCVRVMKMKITAAATDSSYDNWHCYNDDQDDDVKKIISIIIITQHFEPLLSSQGDSVYTHTKKDLLHVQWNTVNYTNVIFDIKMWKMLMKIVFMMMMMMVWDQNPWRKQEVET